MSGTISGNTDCNAKIGTHNSKILALLTVLVCVVTLLGGCGKPFSIVGSWENEGPGTYGQAYEQGKLIQFGSNGKCNLWSPSDKYALKKESDGSYKLIVNGLLGGGGEFDVQVKDNDHITLTKGNITLNFERVG
ncbi:hypothetical protein OZX72_05745 [Bifidobacterium sp. ESL0769]|uniref:hypothetical protein n=1 Tax=Bifidobacterium sp. ESL0769 TaxID=2983229 RepID=UPI0023F7C4BA|nr:hypothetical protein [Bifidobacterium sp. ESL0769]WEV66771.1 hypothetical protein OZX72_05745 [Bifidobacterium sp. ESL0769]